MGGGNGSIDGGDSGDCGASDERLLQIIWLISNASLDFYRSTFAIFISHKRQFTSQRRP